MPDIKSKSPSFWRGVIGSLRPALTEFQHNDPLRMAGATAFFTTFALPPILFLIIRLFGIFFDRRQLGRGMLDRLTNTLGEDGAGQVRQVLRSIRGFSDSWIVIIVGLIFLIFVATTLFNVIKNSFNQIWQISVKDHPGWWFMLRLRLRSMAVILFAGLLFLSDMMIEVAEIFAGDIIDKVWFGGGEYFKSALNETIGVLIVSIWFIALFRFLGDGRPGWKPALVGGMLTGILFTAGKLLLWYLLINSDIDQLFGASGSFVLLLLFVFYSSFIMYYGASFIQVYALRIGQQVTPTRDAFAYKIEEVST